MISAGFSRGNPPAHWHSIDTVMNGPITPQTPVSTSTTWPSANLAIYVPIMVRASCTVKKLWWSNGTTKTGNMDIGLFNADGVKLVSSGSIAKTSYANLFASFDCTDTTIGAGIYFIGLALSSASDTIYGASLSAPYATALGLLTEASAMPLPATATFALSQTLAFYPVAGVILNTAIS